MKGRLTLHGATTHPATRARRSSIRYDDRPATTACRCSIPDGSFHDELSGAHQQRVWTAAALPQHTGILLLGADRGRP
jgi:ABC-type lipoprotein export system ATPase subunit